MRVATQAAEAPQTRSWKMVRFSRAPICGATNTLVENGSLQSRSYLWRHKHARGKWFALVALLFVAPQTRSWKMVRFSCAPICGATNTLVENGSLQLRSYWWCHKDARGKWFASVALIFVAPQTRSWKMALSLLAAIYSVITEYSTEISCHNIEKWFAKLLV
jgi:hypothetical protein